ncbi:multicopper oxidase family protein [Jiella sp. M17.18]|uniref:multicopper oxidase family protein n=1 Tax=Jiella sp. M17.18 TaxID=3234247 RepID=UPI0034DFEFA0
MTLLTRRRFLASSAAAAAATAFRPMPSLAKPASTRLVVERRTIEVNGRPASVLGVRQPNGTPGLVLDPGEAFRVRLENRLDEQTIVHWHGQTPPPSEDGVADTGYVSPLAPGESRAYDFAARPGTHWMHSHQGLQEQLLLAAPLVVRTPEEALDDRQEVTVLLQDFSFRGPTEILAGLTGETADTATVHQGMNHGSMVMTPPPAMDHEMEGMNGSMPGMPMRHAAPGNGASSAMSMMQGAGMMDLNDVEYDAFLANERTLRDPLVVRTEGGGRVRLRLINGATSTAFWIDLGNAVGEVVAADGNPVTPVRGSRFPLAQAQRLDILVQMPKQGVVPVIAQREGGRSRTGIILATPDAAVRRVPDEADDMAGPVDLSLEHRLRALRPLSEKRPDVVHEVSLNGSMMPYAWALDGRTWANHQPLQVSKGDRALLKLVNRTAMAHPMHLHGHHFQVVELEGRPLGGAVRDTVMVPARGTVSVAFDAVNPGRWLFHCHNLYHMATGMMTEVAYGPRAS